MCSPTKERSAEREPETCQDHVMAFLKTYFCAGQKMESSAVHHKDPNATWMQRNRKLLAISIPAVIVHIIWWSIAISQNLFYLFTTTSGKKDAPNWIMSVTMVFGSFIAGSTSEGGAAVAFPVMTLALGIPPPVARDFSFMIQSVGMTASSFTILAMRVKVEWHSLKWVTLGGILGIIVGLEEVAPRLPPPFAKMYFVVIWSSFAVGLFMLNRNWERKVYNEIQNWDDGVMWRAPGGVGKYIFFNWKLITLFLFGVMGGIFSSVAGSGIDICSFSCLTLLFRVCEKVATPTSVVLMAINTVVGFVYRQFGQGGVQPDAWQYLFVCAPIVVIGAPMGSFVGSYLHRLTLAAIIYLIDTLQLVGALAIVQPWTTNKTDSPLLLTTTSIAIFVAGMIFFAVLSHLGLKLSRADEEEEVQGKSVDVEKPAAEGYAEDVAVEVAKN